ncbi:MAG: hypothetical protein WCL32_20260 [Planctomycetota bacterium]
MLRYRYSEEFAPPAPFVHATLLNPANQLATEAIPAQPDCGADRTVIPQPFVDRLQLAPVRQIPVAGLGGRVRTIETYYVRLQIRGLDPSSLKRWRPTMSLSF